MNRHFVIFDPATGEILQAGHEHPFCVNGRIAQREHIIITDERVDPSAYRVHLDTMLIVAKPPPPVVAPTYAEKRRAEYPPLADLADALFWQAQGDTTRMDAYLAAVAAVKAKYPKEPDQ